LKRRELVVIIGVIAILLVINSLNFLRREKLKRGSRLVVETGRIQLPLNMVSDRELEDLPGIGPVIARRIIECRQQRGGFGSLEELKEVKGIGDKLYERILPYLKL